MAASKFTMKYALSGREYCNSYFSVFHRYVIENVQYMLLFLCLFLRLGHVILPMAHTERGYASICLSTFLFWYIFVICLCFFLHPYIITKKNMPYLSYSELHTQRATSLGIPAHPSYPGINTFLFTLVFLLFLFILLVIHTIVLMIS